MYHANLSLIDKKVFNYLVPFPTKFSFYNFLSLHRYADYKILNFVLIYSSLFKEHHVGVSGVLYLYVKQLKLITDRICIISHSFSFSVSDYICLAFI